MKGSIVTNKNWLDNLIINSTPKTPEIRFNAASGVFEISGVMVPEDSIGFYKNILTWVKGYVENPAPSTNVILKLSYINTSSLQTLYDLLFQVNEIHKKGSIVTIDWFYYVDDEDMREVGEDFQEALDIKIKFIAVEIA